ncbi:MAG: GatB/YqeY domain-containing protein, partial [Proteobacteria bacterium]|nr:GatB/YqeY domain-containing protein [Pseudomonadota bacterium]
DLVDNEAQQLAVVQEFMPRPLAEDEILAMVDEAIAATGAGSMQDMGKVMGLLKPRVQGRADMGKVSASVKQKLA